MRGFYSAAYKGPGKESGRDENIWSKVISVSWVYQEELNSEITAHQYSLEKLWKLL